MTRQNKLYSTINEIYLDTSEDALSLETHWFRISAGLPCSWLPNSLCPWEVSHLYILQLPALSFHPKSRAAYYTIKYDLPCLYAKGFYICIIQGERNSDSEFSPSIVLESTLELYIASLFNKTRKKFRNHFLHSVSHSTNEKPHHQKMTR